MPAIRVSDDCNRADAADIGANWLQHIADDANGSNLGISGNRAIAAATKAAAAAYTGAGVIGPNQFAECRVYGAFICGPSARATGAVAAAFTNYEAYVNSATVIRLAKHINGTPTTMRNFSGSFADGDLIRLELWGDVLTVFQNGVRIGSHVDRQIASGYPGMITHSGVDATLDDFYGGELERYFVMA